MVTLVVSLFGCASIETRAEIKHAVAPALDPIFRAPEDLPLFIELSPELSKVRGIRRYLVRQTAHVNLRLSKRFDFRLQPNFGRPSRHGILLKIVETKELSRAIEYGEYKIELHLSLENIAQPTDKSFRDTLHDSVLSQLGIPPPCLSLQSLNTSHDALRLIVEHHIARQDGDIRITAAPLHMIAQGILVQLNQLEQPPHCLDTLLGKERLQLWQDVYTQLSKMPTQGPQFLQEADRAFGIGELEKSYQLCTDEAETRPQTGAARCAGRALQKLKRYPEAIRMWRAHLAFFPNDKKGIIALARCVGRLGDDDNARAILQINTQRFPEWVDAKIELGIALYRLSQIQAARSQWRAALSIDPTNADARRLLRQY